jgi:hypothetical protein
VARIDAAYVLSEALRFLTNLENRFVVTSRLLLLAPGGVTTEFVAGRRTTYQPPVSYFLIWTTIYILLLSVIELASGPGKAIDYGEYFGPGRTTAYAISHLAIVLTAIIPFQATYLYLLISRRVFTYVESVAAVIYLIGTIILLQSAFVLVAWLLHLAAGATIDLALSDGLKVVYLTWFAADLSRRFTIGLKAPRVIVFAALAIGTFSLWRLVGVPALFHALHFAGD